MLALHTMAMKLLNSCLQMNIIFGQGLVTTKIRSSQSDVLEIVKVKDKYLIYWPITNEKLSSSHQIQNPLILSLWKVPKSWIEVKLDLTNGQSIGTINFLQPVISLAILWWIFLKQTQMKNICFWLVVVIHWLKWKQIQMFTQIKFINITIVGASLEIFKRSGSKNYPVLEI